MSTPDKDARDELRHALEVLPEVKKVVPGEPPLGIDGGGTLDIYLAEPDFIPPRVLGTIAAHGWGVVEVTSGSTPIVFAWPRSPAAIDEEILDEKSR